MENLTELSTKFDYSRLQKISVEIKGNSQGSFHILNYNLSQATRNKCFGDEISKSKNSESYKTLEVQGR